MRRFIEIRNVVMTPCQFTHFFREATHGPARRRRRGMNHSAIIGGLFGREFQNIPCYCGQCSNAGIIIGSQVNP